jgi:5-methylcytosine-specific restriction endonuclease McrBC regulatory subunit McrC
MQVQATFTDYKNVIKLVNFINENGVFSQYTQYENIFDPRM